MCINADGIVLFTTACHGPIFDIFADREAIINSVINEVKKEFAREQDASTSPIQEKLNAFKTATPETLAQGIASLKFERIVKLAEQKILRLQTMAAAQTYPESAMVEELLAELLHRPGRFLTVQEIGRIQAESGCSNIPLQPNCDSEERKLYRSADGTCNNLVNKTLGSASTPLRRLIPARYDDGVSRARGFLQSQSVPPFGTPFSSPNPSPRIVSTTINTDISRREMGITHILMQWGQFVDHDIGASPEHETCPSSCSVTPELEGNCYPIPVPETDNNIEVTKKDSKKCAVFKRSLGACPPAGIPTNSIPPREQLNGITHFHDASMIYGHSDDILNNEIRDMSASGTARGSLRTGKPAEGELRISKSRSVYRIALNSRRSLFVFSRIWENREIYAPRYFSKNCYKLLLVALGGLCQAPLAFCLKKSHHHPYLLPILM